MKRGDRIKITNFDFPSYFTHPYRQQIPKEFKIGDLVRVRGIGKYDFGGGDIDVISSRDFNGGWMPVFIFETIEYDYEIY